METKKTIDQCYKELIEREIVSGPLLFRFYELAHQWKSATVNIFHQDGCEWRADYFLSDNPEDISFHLIDIPSGIVVEIKSDDPKLLDRVYQTDRVLVIPYEDLRQVLDRKQFSVKWLK